MDPSDAVDRYLAARFGVGLEQLLLDAACRRTTAALAGAVTLFAARTDRVEHRDGGISETHVGTLAVEGVTYRFRFTTFADPGGTRFVSDVGEFSPLGWQTAFTLKGQRRAGAVRKG